MAKKKSSSPALESMLVASTTPPGLEATEVEVPWRLTDGIFLFDQFGGATPFEIPIPNTASLSEVPKLVLIHENGETAFLSQRWSDAPIARWKDLGDVDVDSASVCVTSRTIAEGISGNGLSEAEGALSADAGSYLSFALDGHPALAIKVTGGDGSYPLWLALDAADQPVAWIVDFAVVAFQPPNGPPPPLKVPPELAAFASPDARYALAGRRAPSVTFGEIVAELGVNKRLANPRVTQWSRAAVGDILVKDIEPNDFGFYEAELSEIGVERPEILLRVVFRYHHMKEAPKTDWRTMLCVFHRLAIACRGVIYKVDDRGKTRHDFGAS